MSGTQVFILLVTITGLLTISVMWKDWLNTNEHKHWQDTALRLSEQETERIEMITNAVSQEDKMRYPDRSEQK